MNVLRMHVVRGDAATGPGSSSLEASDDLQALEDSPRYCPTRLLASFALLMAGHGRCVNTDMMLGDREYAMWQLACARAVDDEELGAVAARLFAYFDEPHQMAVGVLGTA
jgi:hypothetical protein